MALWRLNGSWQRIWILNSLTENDLVFARNQQSSGCSQSPTTNSLTHFTLFASDVSIVLFVILFCVSSLLHWNMFCICFIYFLLFFFVSHSSTASSCSSSTRLLRRVEAFDVCWMSMSSLKISFFFLEPSAPVMVKQMNKFAYLQRWNACKHVSAIYI